MKSKVVTREEALSRIHDGQTIMFGDWHGEFAADEIIDGMLEKGIKFRVNREKLYVHVMTGENLSDDLKKMSLSDKEMLDISEKKKLLNAKDIKKRRRLIKYLNVTKSNDTTRIKKYITYLLNIDITILKIYAFYI